MQISFTVKMIIKITEDANLQFRSLWIISAFNCEALDAIKIIFFIMLEFIPNTKFNKL